MTRHAAASVSGPAGLAGGASRLRRRAARAHGRRRDDLPRARAAPSAAAGGPPARRGAAPRRRPNARAQAGPGLPVTEEGRLLGHVHLGLRLIEERAARLDDGVRAELLHAIACHHDARAARTAEAACLYHANQLDALAATRPGRDPRLGGAPCGTASPRGSKGGASSSNRFSRSTDRACARPRRTWTGRSCPWIRSLVTTCSTVARGRAPPRGSRRARALRRAGRGDATTARKHALSLAASRAPRPRDRVDLADPVGVVDGSQRRGEATAPQHAFERLGCMRVEFKTDALNERSRRASRHCPRSSKACSASTCSSATTARACATPPGTRSSTTTGLR